MGKVESTPNQARYQESLLEKKPELAFVKECPEFPGVISELLEARNRGEVLNESEVLKAYFERIEKTDPEYLAQVKKIAEKMAADFPEVAEQLPERRFQIIVPAYREGGKH